MSTAQSLREERLKKLEKIRAIGWDPYPSFFDKKQSIAQTRENEGKQVQTAGRIMSFRTHGKIAFADIIDETGKIQLFFKEELLGKDSFQNLTLLDIGDIIGVSGEVGKTIAGEISIIPQSYTMLTKTILPLPSTWFGLKDIEERFRKRYLDLILNQEVKKRIETRSKIIQAIRDFLNQRQFLEIETPTLQSIYGGGFARPFITHFNALGSDFYLRISDEMYLKRLIVGGYEKVYEITKVFRNEGYDSDHNPEFTMFEAQIAYQDYRYGMEIIEKIIEHVALTVMGKTEFEYQGTQMSVKSPWQRYTVVEFIQKVTKVDPLMWKTVEEAKQSAIKLVKNTIKHSELQKMKTVGEIIAFIFEECVEPTLIQPTIIYDYPIDVSPLAKKCTDERFTQRFEMFAFGSELGNNYTELNDPIDLRRRFVEEKKREQAGFEEAHQTDFDYLEAIEHGFPPTCGIAIGIDRLVMLLTNATNIKEVIPFPILRNNQQVTKKETTQSSFFTLPSTTDTQTRAKLYALLTQHISNKNLVKHNLSVEAAMKLLAVRLKGNIDQWGFLGLVHDLDWELTQKDHANHAKKTVEILQQNGYSNPEVLSAILAHNYTYTNSPPPQTTLAWALYCCDDLTGLIVATALITPEKRLVSVTTDAVIKKMKSKSFAASINREQIRLCEEKLGIPLKEFIDIVLSAMKQIATDISL